MEYTAEELANIKKRISENMASVAEQQRELDDTLAFIADLESESLRQMARSSSSSRKKRNLPEPKPVEEQKADMERKRARIERNLGLMWEKIHDLQEQERMLEGK
ncbi:hypothetical protein JDV02_005974 [Purpureocillium takamizusanense]|uniref:Uncharacterized protein n=1 Tax=Purpureocillium takamizusanense TaxID=2060973 RepID=A0A9Q8QFF0_9HYPO|nr:uncharacterized protein JDV02_005974 [Purpureocillium takamizusanense]UNI19824.1 hypothetical protein JDV02_005974 [Purpureocillium takamizusanense]